MGAACAAQVCFHEQLAGRSSISVPEPNNLNGEFAIHELNGAPQESKDIQVVQSNGQLSSSGSTDPHVFIDEVWRRRVNCYRGKGAEQGNSLDGGTSYFASDAHELFKLLGEFSSAVVEKRPPFHFQSGSIYDGQWRGHMRHGFGVQRWPDGATYEGEWVDGSAEGKGRFKHINGDIFVGQWRQSEAHGFGVCYYGGGAMTYSGEWQGDLQDGHGVETWAEGSQYEGLFRAGQKEGVGVYRWSDGARYSGGWVGNTMNGAGLYESHAGNCVKGQWHEALIHGSCSYSWADGRSYSGNYALHKKDGFGSFTWPDGRNYTGFWRGGMQNGPGEYTNASGIARPGRWIDGIRQEGD